jgi:hypothetical protein
MPSAPPVAPGDASAPDPAQTPDPASSDLSLVLPGLDGTSPPGTELQSSRDPSAVDPPQVSTVRADPVAGSRRAWVTVLGITIVFETAVLWVAACLSLWRRRVALTQAASSGLTSGVRSVRRVLWAHLTRLPRALDELRR